MSLNILATHTHACICQRANNSKVWNEQHAKCFREYLHFMLTLKSVEVVCFLHWMKHTNQPTNQPTLLWLLCSPSNFVRDIQSGVFTLYYTSCVIGPSIYSARQYPRSIHIISLVTNHSSILPKCSPRQ